MASPSFTFDLQFRGQPVHAPLLEQLADAVLRQVKCAPAVAGELGAAVEKAAASGRLGADPQCDLRFRAHGSTLEILLSADGGAVWQISCAIT